MAGICSAAQLKLQPRTVQEIENNNEDVPTQYIRDQQHNVAPDSAVSSVEFPVVDLALLSSVSPEGTEELMKLHSALSSWGCFQAINHSIPHSMLDKMQEVIKEFFHLPAEEKKRYSRSEEDTQGYGNDTIQSEHEKLNWCDRLYLRVFPEDQRRLNLWPEKQGRTQDFKNGDMLHGYANHLKSDLEIILKAMARSLNLEEACFLDLYREQGIMQTRINFYPRCPRNNAVLGLKPHSDGGFLTMLLQDREVEGLQVRKKGQWFEVPIIPDALLINLGDQSEIITNGAFKSPVHRVVTNSEKERISMALFCQPGPDTEIQPAQELIIRDKQRYKSVKNYLANYFFNNYQEGERPIDTVKL